MTCVVDLRRWFPLQNPLADNRPGVLYFVRAGLSCRHAIASLGKFKTLPASGCKYPSRSSLPEAKRPLERT
jgi:hypothetical protein